MAKTIRVMVAEDFPLLREDFCDVVSAQSDMEVVGSAASGEEIVALAGTTPCDVILMDIEMETIDAGIRAAEVITARHPEVKILFLTAHETDDMITSAMGTGAVDYVVKGCEEERLLEHIRRASEGRAELDPKIQNTVMQEYARLRRSERSLIFFINNVAHLTPAEHELVKLLLQDKKVAEIARLRCVEVVTIKTQIKGLLLHHPRRRGGHHSGPAGGHHVCPPRPCQGDCGHRHPLSPRSGDQDESSIPGTEESHLESGLSGVPLCPQVSMIVPG